jgi:hypothetical protein
MERGGGGVRERVKGGGREEERDEIKRRNGKRGGGSVISDRSVVGQEPCTSVRRPQPHWPVARQRESVAHYRMREATGEKDHLRRER